MKLEKFKQNKKIRNTLLTLGLTSIILGGGIILYRTYALYQDKHEYNVIKGVIPDFGYDVKFAVVVDNNKSDEIPDRKTTEGNYYKVEADCGEDTKAEWDYNAWNLKVDNIKSNSKCNLTFTSNLSEAEYKEYIESGIEYRRNTYRGKDITDLKNTGDLYNQIKNCTFDDIYVGDYILSNQTDANNKPIKWLIADINNYRYSGDTSLTQCHVTIIPARPLKNEQMNTEDTTKDGYYGSNMVTNILGTEIQEGTEDILNKYIVPDFKDHIIKYRNLLSNSMDSTRINQTGILSNGLGTGASSNWAWYDRYLDLMSEVNVYGSIVWSSSGYDIGADNEQYALFKLKPELRYTDENGGRYWYWLKAVHNSNGFALVTSNGNASSRTASVTYVGIRPRFLIG